ATPLVAAHLRKLHLREASRDQWPDFLTSLSAQLAGGGSLPESFVAAGERSGGPFREGAERIADATARGASFADALAGLRDVYQDPIADRILTTLLMAQRSGGHRVAAVLSGLASSIADELRLRKAHHAALTQQRLTAAVALLAPWVLLVLTVTSNPTAADAYRSGSGPSVVLGGLAATLAGYLLAARTARLPEPPRVFR
ncbi:MAG: type II secretion system F family protein, partial [Actinomycetota bacterium]|nr:type II secretion system F family protein [Actinomycetota bacterium]